MIKKTGRMLFGAGVAFALLLVIFLFPAYAVSDSNDAFLETGIIINQRMRRLSAGEELENWKQTQNIKAVRMTDSLPDDFAPTPDNTVSTADSGYPIYILFDNDEDAGIMYFYTEGDRIVMNPDSRFMFYNYPQLSDISGLADWDASHVTSMYSMFEHAASLPDALALRNWNTSSVTDMGFMFSGASSMMCIDVSKWNTSKVTSMIAMFQVGKSYEADGQLREIFGIGNLDVSNVRDMTCMFYGAGKMTYYDIANWDVSKVESMNHMFCDNVSLRSLDLSKWDVSNVKTMYCMFDDNHALRTIGDVSHWDTASLIDAGGWLNYSYSFVGNSYSGLLDLSGWDTHNLKAVGEMFLGTRIQKIDLSGWTFDSITNDGWEGAGNDIYYEYGNANSAVQGFGKMFRKTVGLSAVYVSEQGLDSFNAAVEKGVNTEDMWADSLCTGFTLK